ncbi:regulator of cell division encoded by prophage CP-933O [Shigella sonnei]|nr:regulator of cell division encoded by prophage CP-933O [Shigella sonnei]
METLLPNVNTSEGCFEIGVRISNPVSVYARCKKDTGNEYCYCPHSDCFS